MNRLAIDPNPIADAVILSAVISAGAATQSNQASGFRVKPELTVLDFVTLCAGQAADARMTLRPGIVASSHTPGANHA